MSRAPALLASIVVLAAMFLAARARADTNAPKKATVAALRPDGKPLRVRFDPASRISLGAGAAIGRGDRGAVEPAPYVSFGIGYRSRSTKGRGQDQVTWQVDHKVLWGHLRPTSRHVAGAPALAATLYQASFHRHDELPSLVLPTSPPVSVPFPFDVGLMAEAGTVYVPSYRPEARAGGSLSAVRVGVARAAFMLDPWRSGRAGQSFEFGIGARYDIDVLGSPLLSSPLVIHRVAPLTMGTLRLRWQSEDGLTAIDTRAEAAPCFTSEKVFRFAASSQLHAERGLVAINDQPITVALDADYRYFPASAVATPQHDVYVGLGLVFHINLR